MPSWADAVTFAAIADGAADLDAPAPRHSRACHRHDQAHQRKALTTPPGRLSITATTDSSDRSRGTAVPRPDDTADRWRDAVVSVASQA